MTLIDVECANCGKMCKKQLGHFNTNVKRGMRHCCSRSCGVSVKSKIISKERWKEIYKFGKTQSTSSRNDRFYK
jgi:hypothetical protein